MKEGGEGLIENEREREVQSGGEWNRGNEEEYGVKRERGRERERD